MLKETPIKNLAIIVKKQPFKKRSGSALRNIAVEEEIMVFLNPYLSVRIPARGLVAVEAILNMLRSHPMVEKA